MNNLDYLDEPNRKIHPTFTSKFDGGECPKCFFRIEKGQLVRFNDDNEVVHALHRHPEITYTICSECFLAKPCECDD